jgi:hypothetical protein
MDEVKGIKDYTEATTVTAELARKDTGNRMKLIPTVLFLLFLLLIVGTHSVIDDYKRSVLKFNIETPPRLTLGHTKVEPTNREYKECSQAPSPQSKSVKRADEDVDVGKADLN